MYRTSLFRWIVAPVLGGLAGAGFFTLSYLSDGTIAERAGTIAFNGFVCAIAMLIGIGALRSIESLYLDDPKASSRARGSAKLTLVRNRPIIPAGLCGGAGMWTILLLMVALPGSGQAPMATAFMAVPCAGAGFVASFLFGNRTLTDRPPQPPPSFEP